MIVYYSQNKIPNILLDPYFIKIILSSVVGKASELCIIYYIVEGSLLTHIYRDRSTSFRPTSRAIPIHKRE